MLGSNAKNRCAICLSGLPKLHKTFLPCAHVYCTYCIGEWAKASEKDGEARCPECKHAFHTSLALPRNIQTIDLSDSDEDASDIAGSQAGDADLVSCTRCNAILQKQSLTRHFSVKHGVMLRAKTTGTPQTSADLAKKARSQVDAGEGKRQRISCQLCSSTFTEGKLRWHYQKIHRVMTQSALAKLMQ